MKEIKKICPHCNKEFISNHARRIYCSDSHRISAYNKKKGFSVAIVPPREETGLNKPIIANNEDISGHERNENKQLSFFASTGASTAGYILGKTIENIFTAEGNKPITRNETVQLMQEFLKIISIENKNLLSQIENKSKVDTKKFIP